MNPAPAASEGSTTETALAVRLLRAFAAQYPRARFVEIGANDGVTADPLHRLITTTAWRGVLAEPVPHLFAELERTYAGNSRLSLANVAVAELDGTKPFYHLPWLPPKEQPANWWDMVGSLDEAHVRRFASAIDDDGHEVQITPVECVTLATLMRRHGLAAIDLLLLDTEGYDWTLLRSFDLAELRPRLVIYESRHLSERDRSDSERAMRALDYELLSLGFDTWALDLTLEDRLSVRWTRALADSEPSPAPPSG